VVALADLVVWCVATTDWRVWEAGGVGLSFGDCVSVISGDCGCRVSGIGYRVSGIGCETTKHTKDTKGWIVILVEAGEAGEGGPGQLVLNVTVHHDHCSHGPHTDSVCVCHQPNSVEGVSVAAFSVWR
jgi:hypothetical protein